MTSTNMFFCCRFVSMDGELGLKMGVIRNVILGNNMYTGKQNPLDTEV